MPFALLVALRYLREGRRQTWLILTGVGTGVGVTIFLSALITGLQESLIERTLGTQAHVVVRPREEMPRVLPRRDDRVTEATIERPAQRVRSILQWPRVRDDIARIPGVVATAPTISGAALAARGAGVNSVIVRGIDPSSYRRIVDVESHLVAGRFDLDGFGVVIGVGLAEDLGATVGDRVRLRAGRADADDPGTVQTVTGIFDIGSKDLNARWVFVSLRGAQSLFGLEGGVSTIEVKGTAIYDAERIATDITARSGLVADSWMRSNAQLLTGLRSQSASSIMIQVFVVLAAALGIASVLAVSVVQKSREIGILRATGTSRRQIRQIFLIQGSILGLVGSGVGILLGIGLGYFFSRLSRNPDGTATFPLIINTALYVRSALIAVGVGLTSAVLPASRAARMDPATVIRSG